MHSLRNQVVHLALTPSASAISSSWAKTMLNLSNTLQIWISEITFGKNNNLQKYRYQRPEEKKQTVPYLISKGFAFYKSYGSFDLDKSSGAIRRSLLRPSLRLYQVSCRTFRTLRGKQAEETKNRSLCARLKLKLPSPIADSGKNTPPSRKRRELLSNLPASEASKVNIAFASFAEGCIAANAASATIQSKKYRPLRTSQQLLAIAVFTSLLLLGSFGWGVFRVNVGSANAVQPDEINVSFSDVKGVDEAKSELQDIVEFLRNPDKCMQLGGKLPKGVLLVGPPGTGKTLLARAVAGEASVPFFHAAGPELDEMVGQGASRIRDLFKAAKAKAPCVIFIDEIDSVGAKRTNSVLHPYADQTINQLLSELEGIRQNKGVIVLGATNRRQDLDKALLRPGRFDVEVQVPAPELGGRKDILDYYLSKVKRGNDVDVDALARGSTGFTGADLENMVNQAALRAAIEGAEAVCKKHLEFVQDKIIMGAERKSRVLDEETNLMIAYHESGHALVAHYTKEANPLHKVTIIPRGDTLGHTAYLPTEGQYQFTKAQLLAKMDSLMGGRAAEELIFGMDKITSGAANDLQRATSIADLMVKRFGMSEGVGLRTTGGDLVPGPVTAPAMDVEITLILQESYNRATCILVKHAKELKALAEALIKYKTLDAEDIKGLLSQGLRPNRVSNSLGQGGCSSESGSNASIPSKNKDSPHGPPPGRENPSTNKEPSSVLAAGHCNPSRNKDPPSAPTPENGNPSNKEDPSLCLTAGSSNLSNNKDPDCCPTLGNSNPSM